MEDDEVQALIDGYAARLGRASYVPTQENRDGGYAFWRREGTTYVYAARERGRETFRQETEDVDELVYWVVHDVAGGIAMDWALRHRRKGQDSRRRWFPRWIALMAGLRPDWGARTAAYVDAVLERSPYLDRS
jgi:hypothetical protein